MSAAGAEPPPRSDGEEEEQVGRAAELIAASAESRPRVALVLGSGLGALADAVDGPRIPFSAIPHMPRATVPGHRGAVVVGRLAGQPVVVLDGRFHAYQGYTARQVTFPIRVMRRLGASVLVVTNAAGGLNPELRAGDLMLLEDHLSLVPMSGYSPLVGAGGPPRFLDMTEPYDTRLRQVARAVAEREGIPVREGVYVMVMGPSYETRADVRFLQLAGADAVGMSTVPEVLAARADGMRVLGVSAITNVLGGGGPLSHADVLRAADQVSGRLQALVTGTVRALADEPSVAGDA